MRRVLAGVALVTALTAAPAAQQRPVFRSAVDLVTVDVTVVGPDGALLSTLSRDDFALSVDGSPRRIIWSEFVPHRTTRTAAGAADHFSTNEAAAPGRLVVVAVDQPHIRRIEGRAALRAAANFIDRLDATDRVAVASLSQPSALQFTTQHALVKRAVEKLVGEAAPSHAFYNLGLTEALAINDGGRIVLDQVVRRECGTLTSQFNDVRRLAEAAGTIDGCPAQVELEGRTMAQQARTEARRSINALGALIAQLAEIEGPKTVILLSEGLTADPQWFDLSALGAAAYAARVTLYALQLEAPVLDASDARLSPTVNADISLRGDGLTRLAGSARGTMFRLVGADARPFERILAELSGYYLLAFEPQPEDRDGGVHRLEVKVSTAGAVVRARPSFRVAKSRVETTEAELVRLLRDPRSAPDIPLRTATFLYRQASGPGIKTILAAETAVEQDVTLGYVVVNRSGVIAASGADSASRGRYVTTLELPDGNYMLKVAVIDAAGRRGSVERHFEVRLGHAGGVIHGDLMLAEPPAPGVESLQPVVRALRGRELLAYVELYGPPGWVPRHDDVQAELMPREGAPSALLTPTISQSAEGRWVVSARANLQEAEPGRRLVIVTIAVPGAAPLRLTRTFDIDAK